MKAVLIALLLSLTFMGCSVKQKLPPVKTVPSVDLNKYAGKWYEIAHLPFYWQNGCVATTATYSLLPNGEVEVLNECRHRALDGKLRAFKGKARVVDASANSKLEVQFFWPFWGDYWIIEVAEDYSYALVGTPDREYFWVLSRSPEIDKKILMHLIHRARLEGYDTSKALLTQQKP